MPCSPFCLVLLFIKMDKLFFSLKLILPRQLTIIMPLLSKHHPGIQQWKSFHPRMFRRGRISPSVVAPWASLLLRWSSASWIARKMSTLLMVYSCWSTSLLTTQAFIRSTLPMPWATRLRFSILVWWVSRTGCISYRVNVFLSTLTTFSLWINTMS